MTPDDLIDRLASHRSLDGAPREELGWLAAHGALHRMNPGDILTAKGVNVEYADPKEGYLLWAMAAYIVKKQRSAEQTKAAYELLDFMLGGWYGAKITAMRGYMTNTEAPDYAKQHPEEFPGVEAEKVAQITDNVRRKFKQGGTWQNRWPTHVEVYESEWSRFKAS